MTRGRILMVAAAVVLVVVVVVGWSMLSGHESTDDARVDGHIFPINARIGGTVEAVEVIENQAVQAGKVLVRIDDRNLQIALAKAEADLASAQARQRESQTRLPATSVETAARTSSSNAVLVRAQSAVQSASKDLDVARARLTTAQARIKEAQVHYDKADKDLQRMKPLIAKDEISQHLYDGYAAAADAAKAAETSAQAAAAEAESGVALAEARVAEAKTGIRIAETGIQAASAGSEDVTASRARISEASSDIQRAQSAVDQARLDLEHTVVRATASGIVSRKNVEKGAVIQPGQPLMAVVSLEDVWVTANFKETQLDGIHPGQTADVKIDAYGSAVIHARVDSIASATGGTFSLLPAENASGNFVKVVQRIPVKLVITDKLESTRTLRPGMSAEVTVWTGRGN